MRCRLKARKEKKEKKKPELEKKEGRKERKKNDCFCVKIRKRKKIMNKCIERERDRQIERESLILFLSLS